MERGPPYRCGARPAVLPYYVWSRWSGCCARRQALPGAAAGRPKQSAYVVLIVFGHGGEGRAETPMTQRQQHGEQLSGLEQQMEPRPTSALASVKVLVRKNFELKKRSYQKMCCRCCPCLFLMEFIVPPLLLLLLTLLKKEAPVFVVTTGWGTDNMKCNDERTCTMRTPTECTAGELSTVDLNSQAQLSGTSTGGIDLPTVQATSSCTPWTQWVDVPDPFFYTLAALHWGGPTGPKIALVASDPSDQHKLLKMQKWISDHWYPAVHLPSIPCVDIKDVHGSRDQRREGDDDEDDDDEPSYPICSAEGEPCACAGRVRYGRGNRWSDWQNVSNGTVIDCGNHVFGDPWPNHGKMCVCNGTVWQHSDGCNPFMCSSMGHDCCAPSAVNELATCKRGYVPQRLPKGCGTWDDGLYTCCPPNLADGDDNAHHTPGVCHFSPKKNKPGLISSFADISRVWPSEQALEEHLTSPQYGVGTPCECTFTEPPCIPPAYICTRAAVG
jgi:hypothetical protein